MTESALITPFIIAIDGPAASGKGTLARKLSDHYHLPHLDTGLTYRFVAQAMLTHKLPLNDESAAIHLAKNLDFADINAAALSADTIGAAASQISVMPELRKILVEKQRHFAMRGKGAVLDGRDIGTVVCPQAQVKLYIVANVTARAERRFKELQARGIKTDYETILQSLKERDARDSNRAASPLKPAADAHLLDTTKLSIEDAFHAACALTDKALALFRKR